MGTAADAAKLRKAVAAKSTSSVVTTPVVQ